MRVTVLAVFAAGLGLNMAAATIEVADHFNASGSTSLQWPFDLETTFSDGRHLSIKSSYDYVVAVPQFPASLSGNQYPLAITVQCQQCGAGCMTLSSSGALTCDAGLHICDTDVHTCSDAIPVSTSAASSYKLVVDDNNILHSLDYTLTMLATCSSGGSIDYTVCAPVLGGGAFTYPTACVFSGNPGGIGESVYFGVEGCSCRELDDQGFSKCWDGSRASTEDFSYGIQLCGPYCPSAPSNSNSPSHSPSISTTKSLTASRSRSSSVSTTASLSSTQSPSQSASPHPKSGAQGGLFGLPKGAGAGILVGATVVVVSIVIATCLVCRRRAAAAALQKKRYAGGVSLQGGNFGESDCGDVDYSAGLGDDRL